MAKTRQLGMLPDSNLVHLGATANDLRAVLIGLSHQRADVRRARAELDRRDEVLARLVDLTRAALDQVDDLRGAPRQRRW